LTSLVTNLVDNAIKHGGEDARIRVRCTREAKGLLLEIDDSGAGLDAAQRLRAPGRFYRAADTNTAGAGLGLSIVKTIADIHGADLELAESELGGLAVRIRFANH
jgi:two-component system OmpR family sensor kinase